MPHRCCDNYNNVFDILEKTPNLTVSADVHEDTECLDGAEMRVQGSVVSFLERLDDELTKSLQIIDPHTTEYVTRLRDEMIFIRVAYRCHAFAVRMGDVEELCRTKMRLVDHMYYKVCIICFYILLIVVICLPPAHLKTVLLLIKCKSEVIFLY